MGGGGGGGSGSGSLNGSPSAGVATVAYRIIGNQRYLIAVPTGTIQLWEAKDALGQNCSILTISPFSNGYPLGFAIFGGIGTPTALFIPGAWSPLFGDDLPSYCPQPGICLIPKQVTMATGTIQDPVVSISTWVFTVITTF